MIVTEQPHDLLFAWISSTGKEETVVSITAPSPAVMDGPSSTVPKIFSWSDFPCQGEDLSMHSTPSLVSLDYSDDSSEEEDYCDESEVVPTPPAAPQLTPTTTTSPRSIMQHDLDASCGVLRITKHNSNNHKRRVSFDPVLHVRTHDVILGDHPCCVGGMALQCAWEHCPQEELLDLELAQQHSRQRRMGQLQLSYSQRRQRLQATTGMNSCELLREEFKIRAAREPSTTVRSMHKAPTLQQLTLSEQQQQQQQRSSQDA